MKTKDQVLLEELYNTILSENDAVLSSNFNDSQKENVKKLVHDIMNEIQPHVFDLDHDTYKLAIKTLIARLSNILEQK